MKTRRKITFGETEKLNQMKNNWNNKIFQRGNFEKMFQEIFGIKLTTNMFSDANKLGIIIRVSDNEYKFPNEPIHRDKLQVLFDNRKERKDLTPASNITRPEVGMSSSQMISILKSRGYKIMKRTLNSEEAIQFPEKKVSEFIKWIEC